MRAESMVRYTTRCVARSCAPREAGRGSLPQVREVNRAAPAPRQPAAELVTGAQLRRVRRVARFARLEQAQVERLLLPSPLQTGSGEDRPAGPTLLRLAAHRCEPVCWLWDAAGGGGRSTMPLRHSHHLQGPPRVLPRRLSLRNAPFRRLYLASPHCDYGCTAGWREIAYRRSGGCNSLITTWSVSPECLIMFFIGCIRGGTGGGLGGCLSLAMIAHLHLHFLPPPLSLTTITLVVIRGGTAGGLGVSCFAMPFSLSIYGTPITCSATATMENARRRNPTVANIFLQCSVFSSARSTSSFRCIRTYAAMSGPRFQSSSCRSATPFSPPVRGHNAMTPESAADAAKQVPTRYQK